jgi:hypothetical protein
MCSFGRRGRVCVRMLGRCCGRCVAGRCVACDKLGLGMEQRHTWLCTFSFLGAAKHGDATSYSCTTEQSSGLLLYTHNNSRCLTPSSTSRGITQSGVGRALRSQDAKWRRQLFKAPTIKSWYNLDDTNYTPEVIRGYPHHAASIVSNFTFWKSQTVGLPTRKPASLY